MGRWLGKILAPQGIPHTGWYASTTGSATGAGTIGDPWTIGVGFSGGFPTGTEVQPGDTLWLRGGTYSGVQSCSLSGTLGAGVDSPTSKIHVKQYPGEVAIIDGGTVNINYCLEVAGSYVWFWDFTITSSSTDRTSASGGSYPGDLDRPGNAIQLQQVSTNGTGCKFINMFVKNCNQGFSLWAQAADVEVYGCFTYYHGHNGSDHPWGHGFYSQNQDPSTRIIRDCITFAHYGYNLQVYGESGYCDNHTVDGNILFIDGALTAMSGGGGPWNMGGGATTPVGNSFTNNFNHGANGNVGDFHRGNTNFVCTDNYSDESWWDFTSSTSGATITGNNIVTAVWSPSSMNTDFPTNTWTKVPPGSNPTGHWVVVRPNAYEAGRGHVAIRNWDLDSTVSVDVSSILANGDNYALYHAMDPQGSPAQTGTLSGTNISFPMTGLTVETPAGVSAPASTAPEFAAFIVVKT